MSETFFSPCPRSLESFLVDELKRFGASDIETVHGGVQYKGDWLLAWRTNLESRIATRVLWRVGMTRYRSEDEVYKLAYATTWAKWFSPEQTIRVYVTAIKSPLKSLNFTTLKVKDGLCDHFRTVVGKRPSVDTEAPDMRIHAFLTEDMCTLYLDTSGEPLYKRGFKPAKVEAPLKENLAAGILRLSGWQPGESLLDPMCGSGTFLVEAAQMTLNIAPGLGRGFAFEKFRNFDAGEYRRLHTSLLNQRLPVRSLPVFGADIDPYQIAATEENLAAAGLLEQVELVVNDVLDLEPPTAEGTWVSNPPYGVRLSTGDELAEWYPKLGDVLKRRFAGWNCYFLTADTQLAKLIGLRASKKTPLMNGDLDCRLYEYKMLAGSAREVFK
ncbi:class I SAM-dependent RNA methyltransferase [Uliginosibacterium sp. H3]|uniref:Class I SAM-dependent RNA methyltransferase n=1 Tax=Uliginosibacterium silvisoli TaxID=3114758 RepID=A0ABU6K2J0_9RHOO|nr:class I SAM-dependent RNA methyltransferase [Uliginosibacterium sp. H3]